MTRFRVAATASPECPPSAPFLLRGDLDAAFRTAAEAGCAGVELHLRNAREVDARAIARLSSEYALAVPTLGTGLAAGMDGLTFADPDPCVRMRAVERVCGHLALAAELGSAVIIGLVAGRLIAREAAERRLRRCRALECLSRVCGEAARLGVRVLLEPLNRYESDYINTLEAAEEIAREIQADSLALLADTFHMNIEEVSLERSLRAAWPLVGHVHLADSNRRAPGHGHLDIPAILAILCALGYKGFVSLEVLPLPDPRAALRDGVNAVR